MKNKKLLLIVNPRSGKARMGAALLGVVEVFSKGGYEVTVYPTKSSGDATERIEAVKQGEFELIVACGGDGTLNEVISGLMNADLDIPIGYIPAGTLNEWSTGLGISKTIKTAAKDILKGQEITLDIGKFGNKYFTYTASFGAFTSASYSANQSVKNVLGQSAYFFEGIKSLSNIKPIHLKIECDGKEFEDDYLFGAVSNSLSLGGVVKFDEEIVKLNDGFFEVFLIKKPTNILQFESFVEGIIKKDFDRDGMEFFTAKSLKIKSDQIVDWTLDGEHAVADNVVFLQNVHKAVRFIVPAKENEKRSKAICSQEI